LLVSLCSLWALCSVLGVGSETKLDDFQGLPSTGILFTPIESYEKANPWFYRVICEIMPQPSHRRDEDVETQGGG
jgi:hypothetical protein